MKSPVFVAKLALACLSLGVLTASAQTPSTNAASSKAPAPAPATTPAKTPATPSTAAATKAPAAPAAAAAPAALDFGDGSSATLTTKAWGALEKKDYPTAIAYTTKCTDTFKDQAVAMQKTLKAPAPKDSANQYWALNDVGTCYFIRGKALDDSGDKKGATENYKFLVDNLSFAQCWDPKGWFWPPAAAARKRLAELQFDAAQ